MRRIHIAALTLGAFVVAAAAATAATETREEQVVAWAVSHRPADADLRRKVLDTARSKAADAGDRLVAAGEPARRVLLRAAADDPELGARAATWIERMRSLEDEDERRGLDHDVDVLTSSGAAGAARALKILPEDAPKTGAIDWWHDRARTFRWVPARDRFVGWEPWGADQAPLRFRGVDRVRLAGTKGLVRADSAVTFEFWVRWSDPNAGQYLLCDEAWPEMDPSVRTETKSGFALRRNPKGNGTAALDLTCATEPNHWISVESAPLRVTDAWEHIAVSSDGKIVRLFRDGECVAARRIADTPCIPGAGDLFLGVREHSMLNRSAQLDLRAVRISEGARYADDFVPAQRLPKDGSTLLALDFTPGTTTLRDVSGNDHHGAIEGPTWVPPFTGDDVRAALEPFGAALGETTIVEAERGTWSAQWYVVDRNYHSDGVNLEIWSDVDPDTAGHWVAVPFRIAKPGRYRVHFLGAGLNRLDASGGVSPFAWRIDDAAWTPLLKSPPAVFGLAGHSDADLSPLGAVELTEGEHVFRLRLQARRGHQDHRWSLWFDGLAFERLP